MTILAVVAAATVFALVTSVSSVAMPAESNHNLGGYPQDLTPTANETDGSQAGSTDEIMWMGAALAAIVLVPVLLNRALWQKQP